MARKNRPQTPDDRYLVARGVLKRCTNPGLDEKVRRLAVKKMMQARMAGDKDAVIAAKTVLGEAGPVWWDDGEPDVSGLEPLQTAYADWWLSLTDEERENGAASSGRKN